MDSCCRSSKPLPAQRAPRRGSVWSCDESNRAATGCPLGRERLQTWCAGRRKLGTCNITQFAQNPLAGISAVAAFSCTCILSETANQPKLDISGQNGYFCKFLESACPTTGKSFACIGGTGFN